MENYMSIRNYCFQGFAYILFNRNRSLLFCMLYVLGSFFLEYKLSIPALFSCSGAIVSIAGIFLNIKYSLNFHLNISVIGLYNKLTGAGVWGTSSITPEQENWVNGILSDEIYGVCFMAAGTIIWAYGTYFMALFK